MRAAVDAVRRPARLPRPAQRPAQPLQQRALPPQQRAPLVRVHVDVAPLGREPQVEHRHRPRARRQRRAERAPALVEHSRGAREVDGPPVDGKKLALAVVCGSDLVGCRRGGDEADDARAEIIAGLLAGLGGGGGGGGSGGGGSGGRRRRRRARRPRGSSSSSSSTSLALLSFLPFLLLPLPTTTTSENRRVHLDQGGRHLGPPQRRSHSPRRRGTPTGALQQRRPRARAALVRGDEPELGHGEGVALQHGDDARPFPAGRAEELAAPDGQGLEEAADGDGGAAGAGRRRGGDEDSGAVKGEPRPLAAPAAAIAIADVAAALRTLLSILLVIVVVAPRDDGHLGRDGAERGQRLAAEAERRGPPVEVEERAQLGGVVLEGQGGPVGALDARAVVGDLDELGAVVLEADLF